MKLDLSKNDPSEMVGDGKRPNKFWVTASTDFSYVDKENDCIEHAEKLMAKHGIESKGFKELEAVFSTFEEAFEYADDLSLSMPAEPEKDNIHRITIEDRLNGEVWERTLLGTKVEWGWEFEEATHAPLEGILIR